MLVNLPGSRSVILYLAIVVSSSISIYLHRSRPSDCAYESVWSRYYNRGSVCARSRPCACGRGCDCRRDRPASMTVELARPGPVTIAMHLPGSLTVPVHLSRPRPGTLHLPVAMVSL